MNDAMRMAASLVALALATRLVEATARLVDRAAALAGEPVYGVTLEGEGDGPTLPPAEPAALALVLPPDRCTGCGKPWPDELAAQRAWWSAHGGPDDDLVICCSRGCLETVLLYGAGPREGGADV
jgi:hypothetical protein